MQPIGSTGCCSAATRGQSVLLPPEGYSVPCACITRRSTGPFKTGRLRDGAHVHHFGARS